MAESIAFFDGSYMPLKEAKISIADPAVTKSDIVFDVVSVTEGIFFRLDDHIDRFETSCRKTRIALPVNHEDIKRVAAECVHRSDFEDACVFMCGTRGPYRSGGVLGDPRDCVNGFYAYAVPYLLRRTARMRGDRRSRLDRRDPPRGRTRPSTRQ